MPWKCKRLKYKTNTQKNLQTSNSNLPELSYDLSHLGTSFPFHILSFSFFSRPIHFTPHTLYIPAHPCPFILFLHVFTYHLLYHSRRARCREGTLQGNWRRLGYRLRGTHLVNLILRTKIYTQNLPMLFTRSSPFISSRYLSSF